MDFFAGALEATKKKLAEVEGEVNATFSNSGGPEPASSDHHGAWLQQAQQAAGGLTSNLTSSISALGTSAFEELESNESLHQELERTKEELARAESELSQLRGRADGGEGGGGSRSEAAEALRRREEELSRSLAEAEGMRGEAEELRKRAADADEREAKLKSLLKRLHAAKGGLEASLKASQDEAAQARAEADQLREAAAAAPPPDGAAIAASAAEAAEAVRAELAAAIAQHEAAARSAEAARAAAQADAANSVRCAAKSREGERSQSPPPHTH